MVNHDFADAWTSFLGRLNEISGRLLYDLESCWKDLESIFEESLDRIENALPSEVAGLDQHARVRERAGAELLQKTISQWERSRPLKRALMAIETYDQRVEELTGSLPESVALSGRQIVSEIGPSGVRGLSARLARVRRKRRSLAIRNLVASEFRSLSIQRLKTESEILVVLARGVLQLTAAWEVARSLIDESLEGSPLSTDEIKARREIARDSVKSLKALADSALALWREWPPITIRRLSKRIVSSAAWATVGRQIDDAKERSAQVDHRVMQLRAVETETRLEPMLEKAEASLLRGILREIDSLSAERVNLLAELDENIAWLRSQADGAPREEFPAATVDVVPAFNRTSVIEASIKEQARSLPVSCKVTSRLSSSPKKAKWRTLTPGATFYDTFLRIGRDAVSNVLQEIETEHRKIARQIERAGEVVAFGREARDSGELDRQVEQEALQNALALLQFERGAANDWRPTADDRFARPMGAFFAETRLIFKRDRLEVLAHLAREGLGHASAHLRRNALEALLSGLRGLLRGLDSAATRFLIYIGWKAAPQIGKIEVIARPVLPAEFTVDLSTKELPAIYRRLFRYEAVQDPRFLVGREREMAAIIEARSFWEAGRPASLIIVGERGSGKTSLINCALKQCLEGLEVIRGEFATRLVDEPQFRTYLAELVGAGDPAALESFLAERRRVIIVEELERTFLRHVGYYPVIRALQRLIAATCSTTLWVLATNQVAFRFLDAAVGLGDSFSHRINVATIDLEALKQAILLRHNLSGLRLNFAAPPAPTDLPGKVRALLRGETDSETLFFSALMKECAGVFRTAFDLWQNHIDTAEAGVLYMKALATPDLAPVIEALGQDDLFTLVAILQHGSLTSEEHALVFQRSLANSRAQIDELLAREIIERDPGRPGFRVRPEATLIVKEALYRRNLL